MAVTLSADDILGTPLPAAGAGRLSADDILGPPRAPPKPEPTYDPVIGLPMEQLTNSVVGKTAAAFFGPIAQVMTHAPEEGYTEEEKQAFRDAGYWNKVGDEHKSWWKSVYEGIASPVIANMRFLRDLGGAAWTGSLDALNEVAKSVPPITVGGTQFAPWRELPAMAEYLGTIGGPRFAVPAQIAQRELATIARARSLGVIGPQGEAGWKGTKPAPTGVEPFAGEAIATGTYERAPTGAEPFTGEAPAGEPGPVGGEAVEPEVHARARAVAPEVFGGEQGFDALTARRETFRDWLAELKAMRERGTNPEVEELDKRIDSLRAERLAAPAAKRFEMANRITALEGERDTLASEIKPTGDTPEMAQVRRRLLETEFAMRDLAPKVTKAYVAAERQIGEGGVAPIGPAVPAEAQREAAAPAPTPIAGRAEVAPAPATAVAVPGSPAPILPAAIVPPEGRPPAVRLAPGRIATQEARRLETVGEKPDVASALGAVIEAYWNTRAERFEGRKGTAEEMYAREAPQYALGKSRGEPQKAPEFAQGARGSITFDKRQAKTVIKRFARADASTMLHENMHDWVERLMGDARDPEAPEPLKADAETLRAWAGAEAEGPLTRGQHERLARAGERYFMEGHAPSRSLARIFEQFRDWLTNIYQKLTRLRAPISEDVRDVFDRMLTLRPERAVIAAEREAGRNFADIHEADAIHTPPHASEAVHDMVNAEIDALARERLPGVSDELRAVSATGLAPAAEGGDIARPHEGPPGGGAPAGAEPGEHGAPAKSGAQSAGGDTARAEGAGARGIFSRLPREPVRLIAWIRSNGGLRDPSGDIESIIGVPPNRSGGLINNRSGMNIDDAALRVWEHGYLEGAERPEIQSLFDAIYEDRRGNAQYSRHDAPQVEAYKAAIEHNAEMDRLARAHDIPIQGISRAAFFDRLAEAMSKEKAAAEIALQGEAAESAFDAAERAAKEWLASRGDAWEPNLVYGDRPRTIEDLENERRAEEAARRPIQGAGGPTEPGTAGRGEVAVQESGGPRGGGARAAGGAEAERGIRGAASERGGAAERGAGIGDPNAPLPRDEPRDIDKLGNIRLDNLRTPEDLNDFLRSAVETDPRFLTAAGAKVTDQDLSGFADALGVRPQEVNLARLQQMANQNSIPLAAYVLWGRRALVQQAERVFDLMRRGAEGKASDAETLAFLKERERLVMIAQTVSAATGAWGRIGRAFRDLGGFDAARDLAQFLQQETGLTLNQGRALMQKGAQMETAAAVTKFVKDTARPGVFDWLLSYAINNFISGPLTHLTYTLAGDALALKRATLDTGFSAMVGAIRRLGGAEERALIGAAPAQLFGVVAGQFYGIGNAWKAIRSNQVTYPAKVEAYIRRQEAAGEIVPHVAGKTVFPRASIPNLALPIRPRRFSIFGKDVVITPEVPIGTALELPSRMVTTLHTFNWTTFYTESIFGQAYHIAEFENRAGQVFVYRLAELVHSPTDEMIEKGIEAANGGALMRAPDYDSFMGRFARWTNWGWKSPDIPLPGGRVIPMGTLKPIKFIDPFVQIGANIQRVALQEGTPLGIFSRETVADLTFKNGGIAFDQRIGKMLAGTTVMTAGGMLALKGILNWSGPSDPKKQAEFRRVHGMPHSVTIGNMSYDLLRMGVIGVQMSIAADLAHAIDEMGRGDALEIASNLVHGFSQNILDESWARGPSEFLRAVEDGDRYGAAYVRNFLSTAFMPYSIGMMQMAREVDPYTRRAQTLAQAFTAKIPWESRKLFPARDIWGRPIPSTGWAVTYRHEITGDIVDQALEGAPYYPSKQRDTIRGVKLTDEQYDDYVRISGMLAHGRLLPLVQSPEWRVMPELAKHGLVARIIEESRAVAENEIMIKSFGSPNDILRQAIEAKQKRMQVPEPAQ